ncbi:MAG: hypothetical protein WAV11_03255 [Minisyncoccia bacterium]
MVVETFLKVDVAGSVDTAHKGLINRVLQGVNPRKRITEEQAKLVADVIKVTEISAISAKEIPVQAMFIAGFINGCEAE